MSSSQESLVALLAEVEDMAEPEQPVSVEDVLSTLGPRSFGPIVLLAGLITLAPIIGDIPGVPTIIGVLVALTSIQILFRRRRIWLPRWLLNRSISADKLMRVVRWSMKPAQFLDRITKPRLTMLVDGPSSNLLVALSLIVAVILPILEFIPFTANIAGAALTLIGLAIIARDGLLVAGALTVIMGGVAASLYFLL